MIDQHKSLSEKFLKKGFWLYLFSFIIAPIGYIVKIVISSELTVSEVGILYGIISLITLLSTFNDFGTTESLKYFIPKFIADKRYDKIKNCLFYTFLMQFGTGLLLAFFFFFGADFIANNYFQTEEASNILKIFSLFFLGINIFQIINQFFLAIQDTFYYKFSDLLRMLFLMGSVLGIFFFDQSNLQNYSYSWIIGLYLGILFSIIIFINKYYKNYLTKEQISWDPKLFYSIFKYSIWIVLGAQAGSILGQMDMQMIIWLLGVTEAGYYTNYLSIIGIPFMIIGPIFGLLLPVFSELNHSNQNHKIKEIKKIFSENLISISISFNILFFIFGEIIAYILFGEKFINSGVILKYSILLLSFNFLLQINFNILGGIGKVKERIKILSIAIILNFIMNIIFINYIGVYGAALATSIGWVFIWIMSEISLGKKYIIKYNFNFIIKNILSMGVIGLVYYKYMLDIFEGLSRLYSFGLIIILSVFWYVLFIIINIKEFKNFIYKIKQTKNNNGNKIRK